MKTKPYIITGALAVTYGGRKLPLEVIGSEPITKPLRILEDEVCKKFATMDDPVVRVHFKTKPFFND